MSDEVEVFDYIKQGKQLKHFAYPPQIPPNVEVFADGLETTIYPKLLELQTRAFTLKAKRNQQIKEIKQSTQPGSLEEFFLISLAVYDYSEYYIIQKWINYWHAIWQKIKKINQSPKVNKILNHVDEEDITRAKDNPIQDHFVGNLRKVGSRLLGLCPFHKEKTPSFNIYLKDNTYHCFGCSAHGDSISFIRLTKDLSFVEAVRYLL